MTATSGSTIIDLQARKLLCERDDRVLFEQLDVAVGNGDLLQLAGPNGAGKTTLLRLLAGLNRDYEGELLWRGEPLTDDFSAYASQRLYQGHLAAVKKALTPLENLRWLVSSWNVSDDQLWAALDEVELGGYEETACQQLSAGQQRRVALARLCVAPTPLWILDEPFTALDKAGVRWLEGRLQRQVEGGGAVIITSHHALENIASLRQLELGSTRA
ncbi:MAG: cytochrome c biogenesis heme-transporting ATPase CcmA [Saccharospirillaceae bacterium]|nr:cytochrome c biogenesis heme-transporting ATPase CcmA [Saccharospirillaceae bacterium]MCD8531034.1 cytochrome c biogenesis heme-transporting ATPase CcmA [Saccharospirillaceae bacterium]